MVTVSPAEGDAGRDTVIPPDVVFTGYALPATAVKFVVCTACQESAAVAQTPSPRRNVEEEGVPVALISAITTAPAAIAGVVTAFAAIAADVTAFAAIASAVTTPVPSCVGFSGVEGG